MDNELLLFDRLEVIRNTITQFGEDNFYISYSGGKDSTIVSHLIDMALPNNQIPRVYFNTGIEYVDMVKFVRSQAEKDNRFIIYASKVNIHEMLEKYGYPFKSKEHAHKVAVYQHSGGVRQLMLTYQVQEPMEVKVSTNVLKFLNINSHLKTN